MSSFVSAAPEMMTSAAADLATIGSDLSAAHMAAAASVAVVPAAADEVSAAISAVFGSYAQGYQTLAARAAAFHGQLVQNLNAGGGAYAAAESANNTVLHTLIQEIPVLRNLAQNVVTVTQAVEQNMLNLAQSFQFIGQGFQLFGEYMGTDGQGLVSLGLSLQNLGQSVDNLVQLLKQLPISG